MALEQELTSHTLDAALVESVSAKAGELIQPVSDVRGTAQYRKRISGVLVRRAVAEAYQQAKGREL
jgi:carbon-monoxide dehydrogenase medium subunit